MTTETKVEAVTRYSLDVFINHRTMAPIAVSDLNGSYVLYDDHQSAITAREGEVADRKARHERTERDACMWASRAEAAEKRADTAERRVAQLEIVLEQAMEHPDFLPPGLLEAIESALTKE